MNKFFLCGVLSTLFVAQGMLASDNESSRSSSAGGFLLESPGNGSNSCESVSSLSPLTPRSSSSPLTPKSPGFRFQRSDSFVSISKKIEFGNSPDDRFVQHKIPGSPRIKTVVHAIEQGSISDVHDLIKCLMVEGKLSFYFADQVNQSIEMNYPSIQRIKKINNPSGPGFISLEDIEDKQRQDQYDMSYLKTYTLLELQTYYNQEFYKSNEDWIKLGKIQKAIKQKKAEQAGK